MKIMQGTPTSDSTQLMIDSGINAFGADLLAESFSTQKVIVSGDMLLIRRGRDGAPIYIVVSRDVPIIEES